METRISAERSGLIPLVKMILAECVTSSCGRSREPSIFTRSWHVTTGFYATGLHNLSTDDGNGDEVRGLESVVFEGVDRAESRVSIAELSSGSEWLCAVV